MAQLGTLRWTERVISFCTNEGLLYCCGTQTELESLARHSSLISHLPSYDPLQLTCVNTVYLLPYASESILSKADVFISKAVQVEASFQSAPTAGSIFL